MGDNGYALDLLSPVRHVATEMDKARGRALSIEEMAATYRHPNSNDLARIRASAKCQSDEDATAWLLRQAVQEIIHQVEAADDGFRLRLPFEDVLYRGKHLRRVHDDHAQLRSPFDPMTGRFSENVRRQTGKDRMEDLRESMREFGWVEEFPAIQDERGVVLVGHRRLAVAAELGLDPVVRKIRLGEGDAADARRFRIAIVSNLGAKPFTPEERKDLAEYLYGEREWTMARIAEALSVNVATVSRDLDEFLQPAKTPSPKGGRPKGSRSRKLTPEKEQEIVDLHDEGKSRTDIVERTGLSRNTVRMALEKEEARREAQQEGAEEPVTQPSPQEPAPTPEHACPACGHVHVPADRS